MVNQKSAQISRHYPYLVGLSWYTLPLVIEALKKFDPPAALLKVTDVGQQGPLLVTLAVELSQVLVSLLYCSLTRSGGSREIMDFYEICGGEKYQLLRRQYVHALSEKESAYNEILELVKKVIRFGAGKLVQRRPGKKGSKRIWADGFIEWMSDSPCGSQLVAQYQTDYEGLRKKYKSLLGKVNILSNEIKCQKITIEASEGFLRKLSSFKKGRGLPKTLEPSIKVDFLRCDSSDLEGVSDILKKTDRHWWGLFEKFVCKKINNLRERGTARLMLRDPLLCETATMMVKYCAINLSEAWIELLKSPSQMPVCLRVQVEKRIENIEERKWSRLSQKSIEMSQFSFPGNFKWPSYTGRSKSLNDDDLAKWLQILRKNDSNTLGWLMDNGGGFHPLTWNLYTENPVESVVEFSKQYPAEQAINELYWCLTRGQQNDFKPIISASLSLTEWNHWCQKAENGFTPYWRRQEGCHSKVL